MFLSLYRPTHLDCHCADLICQFRIGPTVQCLADGFAAALKNLLQLFLISVSAKIFAIFTI